MILFCFFYLMWNKILNFFFFIFLIKYGENNTIEFDLNEVKGINDFYTILIKLGNQSFEVQIDTTSSISWVPSISINTNLFSHLNITNYYNSSLPSNINKNETILLVDEDGDVQGEIREDSLKIGNLENIKLNNFKFLSVNYYDKFFKDYPNGKLGLGYKTLINNSNILHLSKNNNIINKTIFTLEQNKIYFGDIPEKYNNYPFSSCNLTDSSELDDEYRNGWICSLTHIIIGKIDKTFEDSFDISPSQVSFDSAFNYISIPKKFYDIFLHNLFENELNGICAFQEIENFEISILCNQTNKFKNIYLAFIIDGFGYYINMNDLIKKDDNGKIKLLIKFRKENNNIWIFGLPFIKLYTVVFNAEEKIIGLYGGEREDFFEEWSKWKEHISSNLENERKILFIIGCIVVGTMFFIVIFFEFWKFKQKKKIKSSLIFNEERAQ